AIRGRSKPGGRRDDAKFQRNLRGRIDNRPSAHSEPNWGRGTAPQCGDELIVERRRRRRWKGAHQNNNRGPEWLDQRLGDRRRIWHGPCIRERLSVSSFQDNKEEGSRNRYVSSQDDRASAWG